MQHNGDGSLKSESSTMLSCCQGICRAGGVAVIDMHGQPASCSVHFTGEELLVPIEWEGGMIQKRSWTLW